jgi:hypothetical protein
MYFVRRIIARQIHKFKPESRNSARDSAGRALAAVHFATIYDARFGLELRTAAKKVGPGAKN